MFGVVSRIEVIKWNNVGRLYFNWIIVIWIKLNDAGVKLKLIRILVIEKSLAPIYDGESITLSILLMAYKFTWIEIKTSVVCTYKYKEK